MEKKLSKLFYSTDGYWKGMTAISKLAKAAKVDESVAKKWLEKQVLWQVYLPPPPYIPRPHYEISKPNQIHQADLLFLPHDIVKRKTYKYALVVIDIATRYKDAEPLTSKESKEISRSFENIYSRKLKWPETLMVDPGKEFMGEVTNLMKKHNTLIQRSEAGHHRAQAFVERANRTLGEKIFSFQYAQEMIREGRSREWVKILPKLIKDMNNTKTRITNAIPNESIKLNNVNQVDSNYKRPIGLSEKRLPPFVKVRYLYAPGEEEGGEKRRATDLIWSLKMFDLNRSIITTDQPILYYLSKGSPKHGFVREELQVIPENSELPPESVLK